MKVGFVDGEECGLCEHSARHVFSSAFPLITLHPSFYQSVIFSDISSWVSRNNHGMYILIFAIW